MFFALDCIHAYKIGGIIWKVISIAGLALLAIAAVYQTSLAEFWASNLSSLPRETDVTKYSIKIWPHIDPNEQSASSAQKMSGLFVLWAESWFLMEKKRKTSQEIYLWFWK